MQKRILLPRCHSALNWTNPPYFIQHVHLWLFFWPQPNYLSHQSHYWIDLTHSKCLMFTGVPHQQRHKYLSRTLKIHFGNYILVKPLNATSFTFKNVPSNSLLIKNFIYIVYKEYMSNNLFNYFMKVLFWKRIPPICFGKECIKHTQLS